MASIKVVITSVGSIGTLGVGADDDFADRLNYYLMSTVLVFFTVLVGFQQYYGDAIHCWVPAEYKEGGLVDYVDNYCLIESLYRLPMDEEIPRNSQLRRSQDVGFYRWVAAIFFIQAFMFHVPRFCWKGLNEITFAKVDKIMEMTVKDEDMTRVAKYIHLWARTWTRLDRKNTLFNRIKSLRAWSPFSHRSGCQIFSMFLAVKLLYLTNTIVQFYILSSFLGVNFLYFGASVLVALVNGEVWEDPDTFPKVAMCDLQIRQMANLQDFTVQCVLTLNLFLEKISIVVWALLVFVLIANSLSSLTWLKRMLLDLPSTVKSFQAFTNVAIPSEAINRDDKNVEKRFRSWLYRPDCAFVIRMVAQNVSLPRASDLVSNLWVQYKDFKEKERIQKERAREEAKEEALKKEKASASTSAKTNLPQHDNERTENTNMRKTE